MDEVGEAELLEAGRAGRVIDCSAGEGRRPVEAALIRRCCHELKDQIDPRGLRLRDAAVVGCLDLAGLDVPFPLRFDRCEFDSAPVVEGARLFELVLTGCGRLPGLLANGVRIRRDLDLSGSHVTGGHRTSASTSKRSAIWLCESDIGGRLLCVDTIIRADGERSIQADRMHVGGTVRFLHQFTAHGDMRLLGARIDGSLDLTGAHLVSPAGQALDLNDAVIGGSFFIIADTTGRRPVIEGRIDMSSTRISGQLLIRNATLEAPGITPTDSGYSRSRAGGTALSAPRLSVGAEVTLEGTCRVKGGMDLSMSDLSSLSIGDECSLRAPGQTALDLTNAELRSSFTLHAGVTVQGTVRLTGARVHGNLSLQGAFLSEPERRSLIAAQGLAVDGDVELQNLHANGGQLGFRAATLGSVIDAAGAHLTNPAGYTLNLHQANVRGSVRLADGFKSVGAVILNRATIDGRLLCTQGSFSCPGPSARNQQGHAIQAISANIGGGMDLGWESISPSVNFTNTRTTFLADDPAKWPSSFIISGFTYDRFEQPQGASSVRTWDVTARGAWLNSQLVYDASPYEQAARVFRQHGYTSRAEEILIAQQKRAGGAITGRGAFLRSALHTAYGATVKYGYRPARVLWLLAALLILVTVSLEIPTLQSTMRAVAAGGTVYTARGPIRTAGATGASRGDLQSRIVSGPAADACGNGKVRCFSPVLYAIDTVVPLVSLDQRSIWYPDSHSGAAGTFMQWWLNAAVLLGWLLSTIFVLSLARLARSS
jgi:hypothetical protein